MYTLKHPEDSILRRHFDSTVELNRQRWLLSPPSDSMLRRHAMSQSAQTTIRRDNHTGSRQASVSASASTRSSPAAARSPKKDNRGFFSRLLAYLTGRG
jgi:hypothetical protein